MTYPPHLLINYLKVSSHSNSAFFFLINLLISFFSWKTEKNPILGLTFFQTELSVYLKSNSRLPFRKGEIHQSIWAYFQLKTSLFIEDYFCISTCYSQRFSVSSYFLHITWIKTDSEMVIDFKFFVTLFLSMSFLESLLRYGQYVPSLHVLFCIWLYKVFSCDIQLIQIIL